MTSPTVSGIRMSMSQNKTISDLVFEQLRRQIATGHLVPGQWLVERELTQLFGVSRTPMREALKQLVRIGLAEDVPYRGVFVRRLSKEYARNVYDLRIGIEGLAAQLASERASSADLERLKAVFQMIEMAAEDNRRDDVMMLNGEFHRAIAEATDNELLVERIDELWVAISLVRGKAWEGNTRTDASRREHRRVFEAIMARQADEARTAMEAHIRNSWKLVLASIDTAEPQQGREARSAAT